MIIEALQKSMIFHGLPEKFFHQNISSFHTLELKHNQGINNGTILKNFYIISKGACMMRLTDPQTGRSFAPCLLREDHSFDPICLIEQQETPAEYVSIGKTLLLYTKNEYLRHWMDIYPQLNTNLLHQLVFFIKQLEKFSESIIFHDVKTRLATLILDLALKEKRRLDNSVGISLHLTHETLAEMVGSVRSVVTTSLHHLKKEGIKYNHV